MVASPTFVNKSKQMTLASAPRVVLSPDDFSPPLKRTEATVPGYWTVEEIAEELEVNIRTIQYLITGESRKNIPPRLKAYRIGKVSLVSDTDALNYLWQRRTSKKLNNNL